MRRTLRSSTLFNIALFTLELVLYYSQPTTARHLPSDSESLVAKPAILPAILLQVIVLQEPLRPERGILSLFHAAMGPSC